MPEIQASYGSSAASSGSTLRMWQQRSGSRSQRFGPSWRCCSATVMHRRREQVQPVALDEPVAGLVGLAEEELRVELDHRQVEAELGDHVHEHRRLLLPRAREAQLVAVLLVDPDEELLGASSSRSRDQEVRARSSGSSTSFSVSAAQAEPQRLERDHLVRRDVPEVDRRAELLDEPGLRRPSSAPRR